MSILPLNLIRYLIVCRVNAPMVLFHLFPPIEFSLALGTIIAESLPTVQARPWHNALEPWKKLGGISLLRNKNLKRPPQATWPVESVLFCYPGKRAYGKGELILMELKLIGEYADHAFFLEVILPALEIASRTIDRSWQQATSLWGKFDIQNIFVARGPNWDTLVDDCTLNLKYVATPSQWSEGLNLDPGSSRIFQDLTWITPFDLRCNDSDTPPRYHKKMQPDQVPSLKEILLSFLARMNSLSIDKHNERIRFWDILSEEARTSFEQMIESASDVPMNHGNFYPVQESQPGCWIGKQTFAPIPKVILPYLALASIFHVGVHTHFGCGTFILE